MPAADQTQQSLTTQERSDVMAGMAEQPGDRAAGGEVGFGGLLRAYRERRLLSQERLAERSGLSARTIRDLEAGRVRRPRGASVRLLADALRLAGRERDQFEEAARPHPPAGPPAAQPVAFGPGGGTPCQLPPDVADFVGRAELVAQLRGWLAPRQNSMEEGPDGAAVVVLAVAGKAGVGKSALAVHVAHQLAAEFPDGQLYASLRGAGAGGVSPLDPGEALGRFLRSLGVDGGMIPSGVEERAALYRSRLAGRRVLVVLDDAADQAQVRPLLPGSPGCAVLVTSRARLAGLAGARLVHLDVLEVDQATELLARIAGPGRVAADPAAAAAIVAACGGLPLAVRIAGARLAARLHWPLARLAGLLADERGRLDELAYGDLEVRASLSLSYQGLGEAQRRLFRRLGLLEAPDVAAWVAAALLDRPLPAAEELLEELVDAQLVDVAGWDVTGRPRYRLHDLLHAYARERAHAEEPAAQRQAALERALGGWLTLANQADQRLPVGSLLVRGDGAAPGWRPDEAVADDLLGDPLAWLEAERAASLTAIRQAATPDPATETADAAGRLAELAWRLTGALAEFFKLRSYRDDYRRACELALTATRRAGNRRGEAWMLSGMAQTLVDQDRLEEAMVLAEQARLLHREVGDRRGEAQALLTAASVHEFCGRFQNAVDNLQRARVLYDGLDDDHGRAWVLHALGRVHRRQGRLTEAAAYLEQALGASRLAGDRRSQAMVLHDSGLLHQRLDRPGEAVACLLQSLQICRELGDRIGEGFVLRALGEAWLQQGASQQAASALAQALGVVRRIGSRRGEAAVLHSLGELHQAQGHARQAEACLEAALVIQRELGLLPRLAKTLTTLAEVQAAIGDHAAARGSRGEARRLVHALGVSAPETADVAPFRPSAAK
jgi:tetratricopeptide (TPR) repeat protein/transcriptional regulator with XRE-family HTH domain